MEQNAPIGEAVCSVCFGTERVSGGEGVVYIPNAEPITLTREQYAQLLANNSGRR